MVVGVVVVGGLEATDIFGPLVTQIALLGVLVVVKGYAPGRVAARRFAIVDGYFCELLFVVARDGGVRRVGIGAGQRRLHVVHVVLPAAAVLEGIPPQNLRFQKQQLLLPSPRFRTHAIMESTVKMNQPRLEEWNC